jgi:hypothetical protein
MTYLTPLWRLTALFILFALSSFCSILTSDSPVNSWQPFSAFYGSTSSNDGSGRSLSHFIQGTGVFAGNPNSPTDQLDFWGTSTGNRRPDGQGAYFTENAFPATAQVTLMIEIAGWRDKNYLALCEISGTCQTVFFGNEEANDNNTDFTLSPITKSLTVNGDWTLVFMSNFSGNTAPTFAQLQSGGFWMNGSGSGQFATFRDFTNQFYYIGVEDTVHGDRDYNDMILRIKNTEAETGEVPEPSTYALCGAALMVLALHRRKK